jgi:hypothetical protein
VVGDDIKFKQIQNLFWIRSGERLKLFGVWLERKLKGKFGVFILKEKNGRG